MKELEQKAFDQEQRVNKIELNLQTHILNTNLKMKQ